MVLLLLILAAEDDMNLVRCGKVGECEIIRRLVDVQFIVA